MDLTKQRPRKRLHFPYPLRGKWNEAFYSDARYRVLYASRGSGKSTTLQALAMDGVLGRAHAHPAWNVLYVAPTWKQAKDILFDPCLTILGNANLLTDVNRSDMRMRVGKARLDCASGERPDNIRGRHFYDLILVDEHQKQHRDLFGSVIEPMLHVRRGRVVVAGTPLGPGTELQAFFEKCGKDPDWAGWHMTYLDAPHLDHEAIRARGIQAQKDGPVSYKMWLQEHMADATAFKGQVFSVWGPHCLSDEAPKEPERSVIGVDWGFSSDHYGVAEVCQRGPDTWTVVDELADHGKTIEGWWVPRIRALALKHGVSTVYCDPSRPDAITALRRAANGAYVVREANNAVMDGVVHLAMLMESGRLKVSKRCELLRRQVPGYRFEETKDGLVKDKPLKAADDAIDALRYALHSEGTVPRPWAA